MKKLCTFLILAVLYSSASFGQEPCQPCTETVSSHKISKILCSFSGTDDLGTPFTNPGGIWIELRYDVVICGQCTTIKIRTIGISTSEWWYASLGYGLSPGYNCTSPYTAPSPDWYDDPGFDAWLAQTIAQLLDEDNAPEANCETGRIISYPTGCVSTLKFKWPTGTTIEVPPGDGGGPSTYVDLSDRTTALIRPCPGLGCCKIRFEPNGDGTYTPYVHEYQECTGTAPNVTPPSITTTFPDGSTQTFTATLEDAGECKSMCNAALLFPLTGGTIRTDVKDAQKDIPLKLVANPTLFHDVITINSNKKITKVAFYDMQGKMVLEKEAPLSNQINASLLKEGMYFMQVHFENNLVQTIKLFKN